MDASGTGEGSDGVRFRPLRSILWFLVAANLGDCGCVVWGSRERERETQTEIQVR